MAFTNYLEQKVLDHIAGNAAYTPPAQLYIGLFTAAPGETGGGTEVSGGSYARKAVSFGNASGGSMASDADVLFNVATASWGTVTHAGIFDASTGGNLLAYSALSVSKTIDANDQFKLASGSATMTLE
jgi:hypothetical protein